MRWLRHGVTKAAGDRRCLPPLPPAAAAACCQSVGEVPRTFDSCLAWQWPITANAATADSPPPGVPDPPSVLRPCAPAAGKAHAKKREPRGYTRAEVAQHKSEDDLWLILQNKDSDKFKVCAGAGWPEVRPYRRIHTAGETGLQRPWGGPQLQTTHAFYLPGSCVLHLCLIPTCLAAFACLQVYDVTSYIEHHPGGDAILWHAGADATAGFLGIQHPPTVVELVEEYCFGWLEDP